WHRTPLFGIDDDFTPQGGLSHGHVFTNAAAGLLVRVGEDLAGDFGGPPRIRPSMPGAAHFQPPASGFGWYLFAGVEGRAVARNIFLDGNTFTDSHSVDKKTFVGDAQLGLALIFRRFRITYTQVLRTIEFDGQATPHHFGAISVTANF
ncbi:MAG: lipid A deacylase LpxR family protein, partial [Alphaproteobacteria bacterium]